MPFNAGSRMTSPSVTESFMDGIQAHRGVAAPPSPFRHAPALPTLNPAAIKTTANYILALRRRFWMVLAVAVPLAIGTSIFVLRMPLIYLVKAEIEITPPVIDPALSALVSTEIGKNDAVTQASFVPNHEIRLRSKGLADDVLRDPAFAVESRQYADAAYELFKTLSVVQIKRSNAFVVSLEGQDPARTKRLLEKLLYKFRGDTKDETRIRLEAAGEFARDSLKSLKADSVTLDRKIDELLKSTRTIGAGGKNIFEEEYVSLGTLLINKQMRLGEFQQQMMTTQMFPKTEVDNAASSRAQKIETLEEEAMKYKFILEDLKGKIRNFDSDRSVQHYAHKLEGIMNQLEKLRSIRTEMAPNPWEMIAEQFRQEIDADRERHDQLLTKLQDSMPDHQKVLALLSDRADKAKQIAGLEDNLRRFEIIKLAMASNECVRIPTSLAEPTVPIRPSRPMLIALGLIASFGLGIGLVCLLEHVDHSVKVPEHVTMGLTLPLLGVVPRIRRTTLTHRGGHLWTSATPDSIEADAYRNIRASLLGITDKRGPIVTLLVTSAKAGEGKSTTAINLAATCAAPESARCSSISTCVGPVWPPYLSTTNPTRRSTDS